MWRPYNNNPVARRVGDCAIRAVALAIGADWESAYREICAAGLRMCDMPSSNDVWGAVLRAHGYYREAIPNTCPICYTFADFAEDNPHGVFVLGTGKHVATIIDGVIYDAWNSSNEIPQFVWYRKD